MTRRIESRRLAYYAAEADAGFWDHHWRGLLSRERYYNWLRGSLGFLERPVTSYLSKEGRCIEAGCGTGQWVLALRARGFDVEGVDFASETVNKVKQLFPDLPVRVGDVARIDVPDNHYAGYVSLGVVEHCYEGPENYLTEAYRVLAPGGVALISVPNFHGLRRLKSKLGLRWDQAKDLHFYQYAFTSDEFTDILARQGFKVVELFRYDPIKGFLEEIPALGHVANWPIVGRPTRRFVGRLPFVRRYFGHMLLVVARKV